jgi:hypothetical protein
LAESSQKGEKRKRYQKFDIFLLQQNSKVLLNLEIIYIHLINTSLKVHQCMLECEIYEKENVLKSMEGVCIIS